jgi:hypothetical protein
MVVEPKVFGRLFIPADHLQETKDLELLTRAVSTGVKGNQFRRFGGSHS